MASSEDKLRDFKLLDMKVSQLVQNWNQVGTGLHTETYMINFCLRFPYN